MPERYAAATPTARDPSILERLWPLGRAPRSGTAVRAGPRSTRTQRLRPARRGTTG